MVTVEGGKRSLKQGADIDVPALVRALPQPFEQDLATKTIRAFDCKWRRHRCSHRGRIDHYGRAFRRLRVECSGFHRLHRPEPFAHWQKPEEIIRVRIETSSVDAVIGFEAAVRS